MAYDFVKLSEVSSLDEFPEGAKVLIEHNGDIKRCVADGLGGGGGYHWIHLDMDVETMEATCDEEITFESLREDIANGIMPIAIVDVLVEEGNESMSFLAIMPLIMIEETVGGRHEEHAAIFGGNSASVHLLYEDGQYIWEYQGM